MILLQDALWNFSWVELAWIASAASGIYLAGINAWEAWLDLQALNGKRNGRRRVATGSIRREVIRGFVNVCFLGVGIVAGFYPANPAATLLGVAVSLVLLIASLAYNANSWLDRRDRIYLMTYGMQARDDKGRFTKDE